ncbi:hypothetical protein J3B02_003306 [Coemansia erecta]|nr:hypothetical protein J3B02_003306 [Coemansia erecta]
MGGHISAQTIQPCSPAAASADMAGAQTISAPLSVPRHIAATQGLCAGTLCEKSLVPTHTFSAAAHGFSRSVGSLSSEPDGDWSQKNPTIYEKTSASLTGKQVSELKSGAQLDISMSDIFTCLQETPATAKTSEPKRDPEELSSGHFRHSKTLVVDGTFDSMLDRLNIEAIRHTPR